MSDGETLSANRDAPRDVDVGGTLNSGDVTNFGEKFSRLSPVTVSLFSLFL